MTKALVITRATEYDPMLARLFALCIGNPTKERVRKVWEEYAAPTSRELWIATAGAEPVGLLGFEFDGRTQAIIRHIAVSSQVRNKGVGRQLIEYLASRYPVLCSLKTETDRDAVAFYQRCGFTVTSLGEKYPGCERFRCVRRLPKKA